MKKSPPTRRPKNARIFAEGTTNGDCFVWCEQCGAEFIIEVPLPVRDFVSAGKAFVRLHQFCKGKTDQIETNSPLPPPLV